MPAALGQQVFQLAKINITHCKIKKIYEINSLHAFHQEVTARSFADLLGTHPDTAALLHKKRRLLIHRGFKRTD